jgi:hypothetical protein
MQRTDCKLFPPDVTRDPVDWAERITINEVPPNTSIRGPSYDL